MVRYGFTAWIRFRLVLVDVLCTAGVSANGRHRWIERIPLSGSTNRRADASLSRWVKVFRCEQTAPDRSSDSRRRPEAYRQRLCAHGNRIHVRSGCRSNRHDRKERRPPVSTRSRGKHIPLTERPSKEGRPTTKQKRSLSHSRSQKRRLHESAASSYRCSCLVVARAGLCGRGTSWR